MAEALMGLALYGESSPSFRLGLRSLVWLTGSPQCVLDREPSEPPRQMQSRLIHSERACEKKYHPFLVAALLILILCLVDLILPGHAMLYSDGVWFAVFLVLAAVAYPGQVLGLGYIWSVLFLVILLSLADFFVADLVKRQRLRR